MVMSYVLRKFKNDRSSVNNRWFAYVNRQGTLSTRGLAQHMIEHGLVGNRSEVESILTKLSECIPELVAQGVGVKLDGLGTFYPGLESRGVDDPTKFAPAKHIKGIHIRIRPWSEEVGDLTSKALMNKCEMEYIGEVETIEVDGKKKIILHRPDLAED